MCDSNEYGCSKTSVNSSFTDIFTNIHLSCTQILEVVTAIIVRALIVVNIME